MRNFCQVIRIGDKHAVVSPSLFSRTVGKCLAVFETTYMADDYAKEVNALARVYRGGRAKDAKEPQS